MKTCPQCNANYEDTMFFCLEDGTPLKFSQDSASTNPATFEQTLALTTEEKTVALTTEENTLNLPNISESNSPTQPVMPQESAMTAAWKPETNPPKPISTVKTENKNYEPPMGSYSSDSNNRSGKLILGGVIGGLAVLGSALGGWWLLQPKSNEVAVTTNVNSKIESSNNLVLPNVNISSGNAAFNNNVSNTIVTSSPITNTNQANPKTSPTKDKTPTPTPTPTPKETPNSVDEVTPLPKTPTPIPKTPTPPKNVPSTISGGVLNGKAVNLVKPPYPPAAKAVRASGAVNVQVTIDENGNVISASAVSGHALLRGAAESAARASKFSPTMLSGQKVKVTGVIVYNFVAQ